MPEFRRGGEPRAGVRSFGPVKTLFLLRHAKSDWGTRAHGDHERPLSKRGERAAPAIGRFLATIGQAPERVVTSSAVRARTTVELAAEAGDWDAEIEVTETLYGAAPPGVLERIQGQPDACERVLFAGHEPTWSALASALVGGGRLRFPTAGLARIDFETARWRDADFGAGELVWMVTPKLLAAAGLEGDGA